MNYESLISDYNLLTLPKLAPGEEQTKVLPSVLTALRSDAPPVQGHTTPNFIVLTYQTTHEVFQNTGRTFKIEQNLSTVSFIAGRRKRVPRIPPQVVGGVDVWGYHSFALSGGGGLSLLCFWYKDRFGEEPEYIKTAN